MDFNGVLSEVAGWPVEDRIRLMEAIRERWQGEGVGPELPEPLRAELTRRLDGNPGDLALPDWHRQELERRRAAAEADPGAGIPWDVVKAQLIDPA